MKSITVLTPTYNRKNLLNRLYDSLCNQTDMDFTWVVVDDGSTDGTEKYIRQIIEQNKICIQYLKKQNGGKHTALNYGIQIVASPLIFIVDSDDYLTNDAIATIKNVHEKYRNETDLCGYSFLREKPTGGFLSTSGVPYDGLKESYVECRINRNIGGDMAEVWNTECLKLFPFPEFPREKFLGEDVVWIQLAKDYKLRFFNKSIYISDYLEDGLTNNRRRNNIHSPQGCIYRAEVFLKSRACFLAKVKAGLQYTIYGKFAGYSIKDILKKSQYNRFVVSLWLPALALYYFWTIRYQKEY